MADDTGKTAALNLQPASNTTPGLVNRLLGPNRVLVTSADGRSVEQIPIADLPIAGSGVGVRQPSVAVATSNRALTGLTAVDGVTITAGKRVLLPHQTDSTQNGPWLAAAGAWTRPSDFNADSQVVAGSIDYVLPGGESVPPQGQNWILSSGSSITGAKTYTLANTIDLSKPPYNVRDMGFTEWQNLGFPDYFRGIHKALWDYRNAAGDAVLQLPTGNGGQIWGVDPFRHYGGAMLKGGGREASSINPFWMWGSYVCDMQNIGGSVDPAPGIGPLVDSATNATSLCMYKDGSGHLNGYYISLTNDGVLVEGWNEFEFRMTAVFDAVTGHSPQAHITSIGGMRLSGDTYDQQHPCMTMWLLEDHVPPVIQASLRTTDTTAGVYGATVHAGTGTGTCVGDVTVKPTEDAADFTIKIANGGIVGIAGVTIQWSIDGTRFCAPRPLALSGAQTIINETTAQGTHFTAKVVLAGALVAGDTYKIPCSGVNQSTVITSDVTIVPATRYDICLQYRGGKVYLYVSQIGGAIDTGVGSVGVSQTGIVKQHWWENWHVGEQQNAENWESGKHFAGASMNIGSIRVRQSSVIVPTPITTLGPMLGTSGQRMCCVFTSDSVRTNPDGTLRERYQGLTTYGGRYTYLVPRYQGPNNTITPLGGITDITFNLGKESFRWNSGILVATWRSHEFRRLRFLGGQTGLAIIGPDWGSVLEDIQYATDKGPALKLYATQTVMTGVHDFSNGGAPCWIQAAWCSLDAAGLVFMNMESGAYWTNCAICLDHCSGGRIRWGCDGENQVAGAFVGREMFRVSVWDNYTLEIVGEATIAEAQAAVTQMGGSGVSGRIVINLNTQSLGVLDETGIIGAYPPFSAINNPPPFIVGNSYKFKPVPGFPVPPCDTPGKWEKHGVSGANVLADGDYTLTWVSGATYVVRASTWTVARSLTLPTTGLETGDQFNLLIESQGFTTTIIGPSGTLTTVPVSTDRFLTYRMNDAMKLERVV